MREKTVENYLRQKIEKNGGICLKFVCPGSRGVPDRICLFPNGVVAFVEVKTALDSKELPPMLRVGSAKRANMAYAAKYFAANYRQTAVYYRFDIIEVILSEHKIRHIENAFTI